jgi:hypothetical protein
MVCNPYFSDGLMIGTFDDDLYVMRFIFTLMYTCVDVKLLFSISYSFIKSS